MPLLTIAEARASAGAAGFATKQLAETELRKSASASTIAAFDYFLSHARVDAQAILGVKRLFERQGVTVYVDWIDDPLLDRSRVTRNNADTIRKRMQQCGAMVFVTTDDSPKSKWMPWELGYFNGLKGERIAILPLMSASDEPFLGQEYLGLYPIMDIRPFNEGGHRLGVMSRPGKSWTVKQFAAR